MEGSVTNRSTTGQSARSMRRLLGWLLSIAVIGLLLPAIDWQATFQVLASVRVEWVLVALVAITLHTLVRALRWQSLFLPIRLSYEIVLTAMLVGQALNYLLPARMGDVPRVLWLGKRTIVSRSLALGTLFVEKLWDVVPLLLVLLIVASGRDVPPALTDALRIAAVLGVLACGALAGASLLRARVMALLNRWLTKYHESRRVRLSAMLSGLFDGIEAALRRDNMTRAVVWTLLAWAFGAAANVAAFRALNMDLGWRAALVVSAALRVGVTLPSMPAALGVYEGAVLLSLSLYSIPLETGLSYALLMHVIDFLPPIALALILVARDARRLASQTT